jgi:uncharacterized protein (DUF433 family)
MGFDKDMEASPTERFLEEPQRRPVLGQLCIPEAGVATERIVRTPGVCGGSARIAGTRIPVWSLVEAKRLGLSDEELLRDHPGLERTDLHAAWEYYVTHAEEIERDLAEQDDDP